MAPVAMAEQLVAAAHRQHRRAAVHGRAQIGRLALQVGGHQHLIAVLTAAEVVQVGLGQGLIQSAGDHLKADPRHWQRR